MNIVLLLGVALAVDPWGRPEHLRAVAEPPQTWAQRDAARRPVRLFWDDTDVPARVEAYMGRGWRVLAEEVGPGFQTGPLPDGTLLRVRLAGSARWSAPVSAPPVIPPAGLARMAAPGPALLGDTVGEVSPMADASGAWVATLGGGLAWVDARLEPRPFTTWDGLPDDRVVSVHADGQRVLVGTPAGAALMEDGVVRRVFDGVLPDPHVQAVRLDEGRLWLGTYRGLVRIEKGASDVILGPWSVFSIAPAVGGGLWVGYEGVRRVPVDAPAQDETDAPVGEQRWLEDDRVFGTVDTGRGVLVAARQAGVRLLAPDGSDQAVPGFPSAGSFGLTLGPGGPWVASGALGLVGPDGQIWGSAAGLAGDTVYAVSGDAAGSLWVGTDHGVGRVWASLDGTPGLGPIQTGVVARSPLPAGRPARDLLIGEDGAWVAGPDGVRLLGQPHSHGGDLVVAAGDRVAALVATPDGVWALGPRAVRLDEVGRLHHVRVPAPIRAGAWAAGALWAGGPDGLLRYESSADRFITAERMPEITRVMGDPDGPWVISRGAVFHVVDGGVRPYLQTATALDLAPDPDSLWVGTADGLERLRRTGTQAGEFEIVVSGAAITAVAADGDGGCWFASENGTVGRVDRSGEIRRVLLSAREPSAIHGLIADDAGAVFVLTEAGVWHVRLPATGLVRTGRLAAGAQ